MGDPRQLGLDVTKEAGHKALLTAADPVPFGVENAAGDSPIVLVCEHAGRAVPVQLGDLGIPRPEMDRHIAYDLGAELLARRLSAALNAPLVLQRYSRLVIDCNRPLLAHDIIPEISDGTAVPANQVLSEADRRARYEEIHQSFHRKVAEVLDRRHDAGVPTALVTVHSFTPSLAGVRRDCQLGLLYNRDSRLADAILAASDAAGHDFHVVRNQPYSVDDLSDYTVPIHGELRRIPHVLLEVRNDLLADEPGLETWTSLLAQILTDALRQKKDAA